MDIRNALAAAKAADKALRRKAWTSPVGFVHVSAGPCPPTNELAYRNAHWGCDERSVPFILRIADLLSDDWELDPRFTYNGAKTANQVELSPASVTDADVQAVAFIVGLSPGAWDQVNAKELVAAAYNVVNKRLSETTE